MNIRKRIETFDKHSTRYATPLDSGRPDLQDRVRQVAKSLITKTNHRDILDAACGNGALILKFAHKEKECEGINIVGIDFSEGMLALLADRLMGLGAAPEWDTSLRDRVHLCRGLLERLPFRSELFDTVICINTLHNLPSKENARTVIIELMRVCKPAGELILEIHNRNNPVIRRHFSRNCRPELPLIPYTLRELKGILNKEGFKIRRKVPIGFPLTIIAPFIVIRATRRA
ncbi:MAG: methyltransferase domain-containing protein [Dehalococcoidia bacterium]|nr:methyltransferase domain-containing protein [Dehalococcoidia bacterium]